MSDLQNKLLEHYNRISVQAHWARPKDMNGFIAIVLDEAIEVAKNTAGAKTRIIQALKKLKEREAL